MAERLHPQEQSSEAKKSTDKHERLTPQFEQQELDPNKNDNIEKATLQAEHEALSKQEIHKNTEKGNRTEEFESEQPPVTTKAALEQSFQRTMHEAQSNMSAPARAFSKIIHNKAIERSSEVIGNTVARPNAILSGALFASILVLGLYLLARHNGFELSGSDTIIAFLLGWTAGTAYDIIASLLRSRT